MIRKVNAKLRPLATKLQAAHARAEDICARMDAARARLDQLEEQAKQARSDVGQAYLDLKSADQTKAHMFIFAGHLYRHNGYDVIREVVK